MSVHECTKTNGGKEIMTSKIKSGRILSVALLGLFALVALLSTGCTVYTAGMTLPNPHYHKNVPQYFPRGAEFPFPNEAANLQQAEQGVHRGH